MSELLDDVFAHPHGRSDMAMHPSTGDLISGGCDGSLKVFDGYTLKTKAVADEELDAITCVTISKDGFMVACGRDDHSVQLYSFPELKLERNATRLTGAVNDVAFSNDVLTLAVAGEAASLKLVKLSDLSVRELEVSASVVSVSFSSDDKLLCAVTSDGFVLVYALSTLSVRAKLAVRRCLSSDSAVPPHCQFAPSSARTPAATLALPHFRDISFLDARTGKSTPFDKGSHAAPISWVQFSPNGRFLLSVGEKEQMIIWNVAKRKQINQIELKDSVSSVSWSSVENAIFYLLKSGYVCRWRLPVPDDIGNPITLPTRTDQLQPITKLGENESEEIAMDDQEDDQEEEQEEEEADSDVEASVPRRLRRHPRLNEEEEDDSREELGLYQEHWRDEVPEYLHEEPITNQVMLQEPFQSGSAPAVAGTITRLLLWTLFGHIDSTIQSDGSARIQIMFSDRERYSKISMNDRYQYKIASFGELGAAFASECRTASDSKLVSSTIFFRLFKPWTHQSEWLLQLPDNENAVALACAKQFVVVGTDRNWLRIFSCMGVQKRILAIPGSIVTLAAKDSYCFVVYNTDATSGVLAYQLLDLKEETLVVSGSLPLQPCTKLSWVSFRPDNNVVCMDSSYVFYMLSAPFGYCWSPILDASVHRKGVSDIIWPIGCLNDSFVVAILKNGEKYPRATRLPIGTSLKLRLPSLEPLSDIGALEEKYMREHLFCSSYILKTPRDSTSDVLKRQVEVDASLLQLFEKAVGLDQLGRALELVSMLVLPRSVTVALKISQHLQQTELSKRINLIAEHRRRERLLDEKKKGSMEAAVDVVVSRSKESECRAAEIEVDDSFLPDESPVEVQENQPPPPQPVRRNSVLREKEKEGENGNNMPHQKTWPKSSVSPNPSRRLPISKLGRRLSQSPSAGPNPLLSMSSKRQKRSLFSPSK